MNINEDYGEIYEQILRPEIEKVSDPFMSKDLDTDLATNVIGRILKDISIDEEYSLEIVDKWPYVFSKNGRTHYEDNFSIEAQEIASRCAQVLESQESMTETEVERIVDYLSDEENSFNTQMVRRGEVREILKDSAQTTYQPENKKFDQV